MRESYPPGNASSSPVPELPPPPPEKFQFSLKQLLAFMFASAVVAAGLRYVVQWFARIPDTLIASYLNVMLVSLASGALLYFLFRAPFLAIHAQRIHRRWTAVRGHRRELEHWSRERVKQRQSPATEEPTDPLNP